jgi:hypothetical protein
MPWSTGGCCAMKKKVYYIYIYVLYNDFHAVIACSKIICTLFLSTHGFFDCLVFIIAAKAMGLCGEAKQ